MRGTRDKFSLQLACLFMLLVAATVASSHPLYHESSGHISWKENPMKGKCRDNDSSNSFDCNLVQILDEGLLLIQDLRAGGAFAAQPKSDFTTQTSGKVHEQPRTPHVLQGSGPSDPAEDFRTNVFLNLEGI